ncbi:SMC-Scp complex subunit ScpB [bacterium]|nr:SMC-Scp complex subunit ScpB [bacterium]
MLRFISNFLKVLKTSMNEWLPALIPSRKRFKPNLDLAPKRPPERQLDIPPAPQPTSFEPLPELEKELEILPSFQALMEQDLLQAISTSLPSQESANPEMNLEASLPPSNLPSLPPQILQLNTELERPLPIATPVLDNSLERPVAMSKKPTDSFQNEVIAPELEQDLSSAAQEWLPDAEEESEDQEESETEESAMDLPAVAPVPVTFVMDPYGIPTLSVADAQNQEFDPDVMKENEELEELEDEPLELASPEESDEQLERLAESLKEEEEQLLEDAAENEAQIQKEAAELLASQIAEDEALAKQMAEEMSADEIDPELLAALPKTDADGNLDLQEMESCIEALLFMLDKPVSAQKLQELLTASEESEKPKFSLIQEAITSLRDRYNKPHHGIELVEVAGGFQFRTKTGRAALAKKLAKVTTQRLSSGAMETLAIVAYRQPVLKEEIDKVRGVDSSHFIRGLLDKKLIEISGRSDLPGRPMLYSTSKEFLEIFGLKDLAAMPPLQEIEQMVPTSQSSKDEDPRIVKMRELVNEMTSDPERLAYNPREDETILQEIKTKVASISTTTPYLEEQKAIEKAVALAKAEGREIPEDLTLLLKKPEDLTSSLGPVDPSETPAAEI